MGKLKEFLLLPLMQILVGIIGLIMSVNGSLALYIYIPLSLVIYIAAGFLFSKVKSQKIKIVSAAVAVLLVAAAYIAVFVSAEYVNTDDYYMIWYISPFGFLSSFLSGQIFNNLSALGNPVFNYIIITLLSSVCPILLTALSAKVFSKKNLKSAG